MMRTLIIIIIIMIMIMIMFVAMTFSESIKIMTCLMPRGCEREREKGIVIVNEGQ